MNIPIYKKDLALKLQQLGFECVDERPNYKEKGKTVFYFKNTENLHQTISELSISERKILKVYSNKIANELLKLGYELIEINTTGKYPVRIFKWTPTIYEDKQKIKKLLFEEN